MSEGKTSVKEWGDAILYTIIAVFIIAIVGALVYFILGTFNNTGITVPKNVNLLAWIAPYFPIIGTLIAIFILILIIVPLIIKLKRAGEEWS